MNINMMFHAFDGRTWPTQWDTDHRLPSDGGEYEFVGTDTLDGGLSLTLRFSDAWDVDSFMVIAQEAYAATKLNPDQVVRWGKFMDSLATLLANAPNGTAHLLTEPQPVQWTEPPSYHAGIDAVRLPPPEGDAR